MGGPLCVWKLKARDPCKCLDPESFKNIIDEYCECNNHHSGNKYYDTDFKRTQKSGAQNFSR